MRPIAAIACSILGATFFSVVLAAAHWLGRIRIIDSVMLGLMAVVGFLIMAFGYRLQKSVAILLLDVVMVALLLGLIYPAVRNAAAPIMKAGTRSRVQDVSNALAAYTKPPGSYPQAKTIDDLARQLEPTYISRMPRGALWLNPWR